MGGDWGFGAVTVLVRLGAVAGSRRYALELVKPSSVGKTGGSSTATITANGSVDFALCETLSLNDVFLSQYDNYMVVLRYVASSGTTTNGFVRLRAAGSDNSTANSYVRQFLLAQDTAVTGGRVTADAGIGFNAISTQRSGATFYFYGPNLAQPTAMRNITIGGANSAEFLDVAGTHNQSTAYDGFTVLITSGTFSGNIAVYGMRG